MATAEKRSFIRVIVDFLVTIETSDSIPADCWPADALNVSLEGILLRSQNVLPGDTQFLVQFPAEWGNIRVKAATVRREGTFYACKFLDAAPEIRLALDQTIYQHWRRTLREGLPVEKGGVI